MNIVANMTLDYIRQIGAGQGQNSTVWLAHDPQLNCQLAVKQLDKAAFWNPDLFSEAQAVYAVPHPNIVGVQYACETATHALIAMPFYPNGSLADAVANGPLALKRLVDVGLGILQGLQHIHVRNYLHLDLKPSNIFFDAQGRPLIADFGQSRVVGPTGIVTAPPIYRFIMPPEVLLSTSATAQSDTFQVALLLYRVANGEKHWKEQLVQYPNTSSLSTAIIAGKFPDRRSFLPHVPASLKRIIRKGMKTAPSQRYESANAFLTQLSRVEITCDWLVTQKPNDEMEWSCTPSGKAPVLVALTKEQMTWCTRSYTVASGVRRAKGRESWGCFTSRKDAMENLVTIFQSL